MRGDVMVVLTGWLLTYLMHSTALLGVVAIVTRWRGLPLAARELLWKSAMVAALATATMHVSSNWAPAGRLNVSPPARELSSFQALPSAPTVSAPDVPGTSPAASNALPANNVSPPFGLATIASWDWRTVFVTTWGAIAAVLLLSLGLSRYRLLRRIGRREDVTDPQLVNMFAELCDAAGIRRDVRLTASRSLASPVALGPSEICLPFPGMATLTLEQQRGVLAHELAHVVRHDPEWLALALVIERALFIQPLNWMGRRELQVSAEYLCDDWAARQVGNGLPLARCLLRVAEWLAGAPGPHPAPAMAAHGSHLLRRVERLIKGNSGDAERGRRLAAAIAGALVTATLVVAPAVTADVPATRLSAESGSDAKHKEKDVELAPEWRAPDPVKPESKTPDNFESATTSTPPASDGPVGLNIAPTTIDWSMQGDKKGASQDTSKSKRVVLALVAALKDGDPTVRAAAAEALGRLGDASAAGDLAAALRDSEPTVQREATFALAELEDPRAVEPLIAATRLADAEVREKAADALGNLEDPRAIPALERLLSDQNTQVRKSAINALSQFELTAAPEALLAALRDQNAEVRHEAAHTVGHIGDRRAVTALKTLLEDPNSEVRDAAVEALHEIGDEAALQALIGALKSPYPEVRRASAEALGQKKD